MDGSFSDETISNFANHFFVIFVRIGALTFFLPGFGETYVSARIKLVIASCVTLIIFPIIEPQILTHSTSRSTVIPLIFSEALVGVFWGSIIRMVIFSLQIAGSIISQSTSLAQIFGGTINMDAQPAMGHILVVSGIALLSILGLHEIYIRYILNTYAVSPPGIILTGIDVSSYSSRIIGQTFAMAFQIAAAALTASLLYNIILGVINRAMPQLLVSFVGAPAITAGGLFILFIMAPTIMEVWIIFVERIINTAEIN